MNLPTGGTAFQIHKYASPPPSSSPSSNPPSPDGEETINLRTASTWTHVGGPLNPSSLPPSFHTWHRGTFTSGSLIPLLAPFLEFLHEFMRNTHMTHYCLSIRAQKPTSEFDIPRWHVDRRFFEADIAPSSALPPTSTQKSAKKEWKVNGQIPKTGKDAEEEVPSCWKIATALIGPGTLFLQDSLRGFEKQQQIEKGLHLTQSRKGHFAVNETHICTSFRCLGCADMAESVRQELVKELEGMETVQVKNGEVAVFRVDGYNSEGGKGERVPAMHSEPVLTGGDRVFVHVVPGREAELRRLVEGWGMEFPRDWYVGVLGDLGEGVDGDLEE